VSPADVLAAVAAKDDRYKPFVGLDVTGDPPECRFLGRELTGPERDRHGLGHGRRWSLCLATAKPLGPHVCPCAGCGPGCRGYDDGTPKPVPAPPRRHCLMHCYPVAGNGVWQRAVAQLAARRGLFDGRVVIAVATGAKLDPPAEIARLAPWADVIPVPNDPGLREVATWGPLWDRLAPHLGAADAVLYCHSKGATRSVDPGNSCHWWGSLMWSLCLDRWPLVARLLADHPIAGPFMKVGYGFGFGFGRFHYSGTFFWVRAADFLSRRRQTTPPRQWWGVEAWPGLAYDVGEAGCLFHRGKVPGLDLYSPGYWSRVLLPEYATWLQQNPPAWP
jgi:hypothetical protein